eukprot:328177_1
MFKLVRKYRSKNKSWTLSHILPKIRDISMVIDNEINRRYAVSLSKLHHYEKADEIFKTINLNHHYLHRLEYGYFLLKYQRYQEAQDQFVQALNIIPMNEHTMKSRIYMGYAEVLSCMEQPYEAEKYYKLCIEEAESPYAKYVSDNLVHHFKYGMFLYNQKRYKESLNEFQISLHGGDEKFATNHVGISKPLYKLGMYKEYEYHLKRALQIDPSFYDAQFALDQYYDEQKTDVSEKKNNNSSVNSYVNDRKENSIISDNVKTNINNNVYNIEFDRFWFDNMVIIND